MSDDQQMAYHQPLPSERVKNVTVPTAYFRARQLPPVCVLSGQPADDVVEMKVKSRIGAQWLLLLVGVFPMVLVRVLTVKRATGYVPVQRAALARFAEAGHPLKVVTRILRVAAGILGLLAVFLFVGSRWSVPQYPVVRYLYDVIYFIYRTVGRLTGIWDWEGFRTLILALLLLVASIIVSGITRTRTSITGYLDRSGEFLTIKKVSRTFADAVRTLPPPAAVSVGYPQQVAYGNSNVMPQPMYQPPVQAQPAYQPPVRAQPAYQPYPAGQPAQPGSPLDPSYPAVQTPAAGVPVTPPPGTYEPPSAPPVVDVPTVQPSGPPSTQAPEAPEKPWYVD